MSVPLSDADKMRAMRAQGVTIDVIAAVFDKARATVSYHVNPAYRERQRAKNNARQKAKRRARGLKPTGFQPQPNPPVYDDGEVWIEDRTILRFANTDDRERAIARYRKTGSTAPTKRPENRPETGPQLDPTHYVPAPLVAWDRFYAHGDGNAVANYLRSIGR